MGWNADYYAHHDGEAEVDSYAGSVSRSDDYYEPYYKYQFRNEEDLITSEIFQKCLGQSLAHKDRIISGLQDELLERGERDE